MGYCSEIDGSESCASPYQRTDMSKQALNQFGALMVTLLMAIMSGLITGSIAKVIQMKVDPVDKMFNDKLYWEMEGPENPSFQKLSRRGRTCNRGIGCRKLESRESL